MAEKSEHDRLIHDVRNCQQTLFAVERQLGKAIDAFECGDVKNGVQILKAVRSSLPHAIGALNDRLSE